MTIVNLENLKMPYKRKPEMFTDYESCPIVGIYTLIDPLDNLVRYVGQSVDYKERLRQHIHEARSKKGNGTHKSNWIYSLLQLGRKPVIQVIEYCSVENANIRESFYINLYKKQIEALGKDLTNSDCGFYTVSYNTTKGQKNKTLESNGSIGVNQKKGKELWEVYISIDSKRYYCGNFKNKRVAQKVYDAVARNYLNPEVLVLNFEENKNLTYKLTVDKAQEISNKFSRRRNNWTAYPGFYKQSSGKWDVNIRVRDKWVRLGRTEDLELGLLIRDRVAKELKIDTIKYVSDTLEPISIKDANIVLTGKKRKYKGISEIPYGYQVSIFLEGKNQNIGFTKDLTKAVYYYDCVANHHNKKSNGTTQDKLSLEEARQQIKLK
jgi:hypothetical protein